MAKTLSAIVLACGLLTGCSLHDYTPGEKLDWNSADAYNLRCKAQTDLGVSGRLVDIAGTYQQNTKMSKVVLYLNTGSHRTIGVCAQILRKEDDHNKLISSLRALYGEQVMINGVAFSSNHKEEPVVVDSKYLTMKGYVIPLDTSFQLSNPAQ